MGRKPADWKRIPQTFKTQNVVASNRPERKWRKWVYMQQTGGIGGLKACDRSMREREEDYKSKCPRST